MAKRLYVGNLSYDMSNAELEQLFSQFGPVETAEVIVDRRHGAEQRIRLRGNGHGPGGTGCHCSAEWQGIRRASPDRE